MNHSLWTSWKQRNGRALRSENSQDIQSEHCSDLTKVTHLLLWRPCTRRQRLSTHKQYDKSRLSEFQWRSLPQLSCSSNLVPSNVHFTNRYSATCTMRRFVLHAWNWELGWTNFSRRYQWFLLPRHKKNLLNIEKKSQITRWNTWLDIYRIWFKIFFSLRDFPLLHISQSIFLTLK